jgi:hypothetical protein
MKTFVSAAFVITTLALSGCSSSGGGASSGKGGVVAQTGGQTRTSDVAASTSIAHPIGDAPRTQPARSAQPAARSTQPKNRASQPTAHARNGAQAKHGAAQPKPAPKNPNVSILKLDPSEVPAEVRAIERVIDRQSVLLADAVTIEVSKNYEWDLGLTGDAVSPQKADRGGTISEATGNPRCCFRNLDIRARDKITVWRSGLGVTPFIRVHATGKISYIDNDDATGKPRVKRAGALRITNAHLAFEEQILGIPTAEELSARPTGSTGNK